MEKKSLAFPQGKGGLSSARTLTLALFVFYVGVLAWIILFKNTFSFAFLNVRINLVITDAQRSVNLVPLGGMLYLNGKPSYTEIIYNGLAFVPFGVFWGALCPKKPLWRLVLPILCTSLVFEVLQYIFALGASDVTDVMANTLGGLVGLLLFFVLRKIFREKVNGVVNGLGIAFVIGFAAVMSLVRPA